MSAPFVAEIRIFPYNFAPQGWALCNGQLMPISQNTALFSLIGTFYGGNGTTNFALPNLQGSVPVHQGQGSGLTPYPVGATAGAATVTVTTEQLPAHAHTPLQSFQGRGPAPHDTPVAGDALTTSKGTTPYAPGAANTQLGPTSLAVTGGGQPHTNLMPSLTLTFCIALQGIFPSRS